MLYSATEYTQPNIFGFGLSYDDGGELYLTSLTAFDLERLVVAFRNRQLYNMYARSPAHPRYAAPGK